MKIEVLLATMFFENEAENYLDEMNAQTDMVIGNQCDRTEDREFTHNGHKIKLLSRNERGVGKNRNTCLFNSDADVVIFADNDVKYYDGAAKKVEEYYNSHPDADVVIFNFRKQRGDEEIYDSNKKNKKAKRRDATKFGAPSVTARRESLLKSRISFSLMFGGGTKYSCGEDTLFLIDCYRNNLNVYLCDETLGTIIARESTWFTGITEKYVYDKGILFRAICPRMYRLAIYYHVFKHKKLYAQYGSVGKTLKLMLKGAKDYAKR